MAEAPPLALTVAAHSEQKGWRRNQDLIDALPYVDSLAPEEKQVVDALIEEEMRRSTKRPADYLEELPPLPRSRLQEGSLAAAELRRAAAGEKLAAVSFERYNLNPPAAAHRGDPGAWRAALDNAHAQLEQQRNRLLNLELLLKYGPQAWRAHNEAVAAYLARVQGALGWTRGAIDDLNRERKLQQTAAGRELRALEGDYMGLVEKNREIEAACAALEAEAEAMRRALGPQAAAAVLEASAADNENGA